MKKSLTLITLFMLSACTVASEDTTQESPLLVPNKPNSPCNQLHKVTSRDDLLKQLYKTAYQDDCAFDLTNEQLQTALGVPVQPLLNTSKEEADNIKKNPILGYKDIDSPIGLHVETRMNQYMVVSLTRKGVLAQRTMFPEGNFPKFLGQAVPLIRVPPVYGINPDYRVKTEYPLQPNQFIQFRTMYCWSNKNIQILTASDRFSAIRAMSFRKNISNSTCIR